MSGITVVDRQMAWNIKILKCPPRTSCVAGAFQFWHQPFLCWRDLFNDLILCFDLDTYLASSSSVLALWIRNSDKVVVHGIENPYVSYTTESNTEESKFSHNSLLLEISRVNLMKIRSKRSCISP